MLDELLSSIMEWYSIVLMLSSSKISVIHLGLFHSREIVYSLINNYKFDLIEDLLKGFLFDSEFLEFSF